MIEFPFARGTPFTLGALRAFERTLLDGRRADRKVDAWLHEKVSDRGWVRDRSYELFPIYMFGEHLDLPESTGVLWRDRPDFILSHAGGDEPVEVTTTAPQWVEGIDHGHQRAIESELHNKQVPRVGHIFSRDQGIPGWVAMGRIAAIDSSGRIEACERGLVSALIRKNEVTFDASNCTLLVYCDGFGIQTIDGEFPTIAEHTAASVHRPPFARILAIHEVKYDEPHRELGAQDMTHMLWKAR